MSLALHRWRTRIVRDVVTAFGPRALRSTAMVMLDAIAIGAFVIGAVSAYTVLNSVNPSAPGVLHEILRASLLILASLTLGRALFAPGQPHLRLIRIEDGPARTGFNAIVAVVGSVAVISGILRALRVMSVEEDVIVALGLPLSLAPFAYLAWAAMRAKGPLALALIERVGPITERKTLESIVVGLTAVLLLAVWLVTALGILRGVPGTALKALASLGVVALVPVVGLLIHSPLARLYTSRDRAPEAAATAARETAGSPPTASDARAEAPVRRIMRAVWVVLLLGVALAIAFIWELDATSL